MTEREYFNSVEEIRHQIAGKNLDGVSEALDELYCYKPVRLLWFVAKAESLAAAENPDWEAVWGWMHGKIYPLYPYPGVQEHYTLNAALLASDPLEKQRALNSFDRLNDHNPAYENFSVCLKEYLEHPEGDKSILSLFQTSYDNNHLLLAFIIYLSIVKKGKLPEDHNFWLFRHSNFGYIENQVYNVTKKTFILVADRHIDAEFDVLISILGGFGHRVFVLNDPVRVDIEAEIAPADTVEISLENREEHETFTMILPLELYLGGELYADNRAYIIDEICRTESENDLATVIASGEMLDNLRARPESVRRMDRLSPYTGDYLEDTLQFGWAGDYLSYISEIYGYDVRADLDAAPECDFSIVIPARNSAELLRYTLESCLNQRYEGSYEIVLSDNSTDGNTAVYDLWRALDDPRIKYYKTPKNLSLTKSFEYAYLKARGNFVFSIGSDDGVLPFALDTIDTVLREYPDEDILLWERGFYAWPGFNGKQQNQFLIPRNYQKGEYCCHLVDQEALLAKILFLPEEKFALPLFYINSGYRRRYLKTLYEKTGRLWGGANQDISMGVVNSAINDHILSMEYPLTIAGMSPISLGASVSASSLVDDEGKRDIAFSAGRGSDNLGIYERSVLERSLLPLNATETAGWYTCILHEIAAGLLPMESLNFIDFKKVYRDMFSELSLRDERFDMYLHTAKYTANNLGPDFAEWFDQEIYGLFTQPRYFDPNKVYDRSVGYEEGPTPLGGIQLDASKHDVTNIAEACKLFEKLAKL